VTTQEQLLLAIRVATRAHEHQVRKDGTPYIAHPMRVMARVMTRYGFQGHGRVGAIAAVLHDVVEDTDVTLDHLREMGFDQEVIEVVDRLSRRPGESYADFILRAAGNDISSVVKLDDIDDNLEDQSALDPEEAEFLRERYTKAREVLSQ
jgi:(p)ppGpp synthase/HD superfamily hydrolase